MSPSVPVPSPGPSSVPSAAPDTGVPSAAAPPVPTAARRFGASPLAGIALMVLATVVFAAQDAITKALAQSLPIGQIVFVRFAAFLAFALAFAARGPGVRAAFRSAVPGASSSGAR